MTPLPVDELLAPIPGDNPAGSTVPFTVKAELDEARKEIDPADWPANDPTRPTEMKKADWPGIAATTTKLLKETSKDLLTAARLTEALARQHGFAGMADGLGLMNRMVADCWDRMHPEIEDGDLEVRAGPFNWLGDDGSGARFPNSVRSLPLVSQNGTTAGWAQWKLTETGKGPVTKEAFEKAVAAAPREACKATFEAVARCLTEINAINQAMTAKLGPDAPPMTGLKSALGDCYALAKQILDKKGPEPVAAAEPDPAAAAADGSPAAAPVADTRSFKERAVLNRAEVYRKLEDVAEMLETIEPHSPIPYLIRKAIELGQLPFPQLMKALVANADVLKVMNRELGIKDDDKK